MVLIVTTSSSESPWGRVKRPPLPRMLFEHYRCVWQRAVVEDSFMRAAHVQRFFQCLHVRGGATKMRSVGMGLARLLVPLREVAAKTFVHKAILPFYCLLHVFFSPMCHATFGASSTAAGGGKNKKSAPGRRATGGTRRRRTRFATVSSSASSAPSCCGWSSS